MKSISSEQLILAIRSVYSGFNIIHKNVSKAAMKNTEENIEEPLSKSFKVNEINISLSQRDIKIIQCIVEGKTNAVISKELFLTEGRVRNIITEIINKLSLKDKAQLVAFAFKNNLV